MFYITHAESPEALYHQIRAVIVNQGVVMGGLVPTRTYYNEPYNLIEDVLGVAALLV